MRILEERALLRQIAADQHSSDPIGQLLEIDLVTAKSFVQSIQAGLISIDSQNETCAFTSKGIRDELAAEHHLQDLTNTIASNPSDIFAIAHHILMEESSERTGVAGKLMCLLNEQIDIFETALNCLSQNNCFPVLRCIGAAIACIDKLPVQKLCELVTAQNKYTKSDYLQGDFFNTLATELKSRTQYCHDLLDHLRSSIDVPNISTYQVVCTSSMPFDSTVIDRLVLDYSQESTILRQAVTSTAGSLLRNPCLSATTTEQLVEFIEQSLSSDLEELQQSAIFAMGGASSNMTKFDQTLIDLAIAGNKLAAVTLSEVYWRFRDLPLRSQMLEQVLSAVGPIISRERINSTYFDYTLKDLLDQPDNTCLVIECLEQWILHDEDNMNELEKALPCTIQALFTKPQVFATVITRMLVAPDLTLPLALRNLLGSWKHSRDTNGGLQFDIEQIEQLDRDHFNLLLLGLSTFIFDIDIQLSLVFSLFEIKSLSIAQLEAIREFLINDAGFEYPGSVLDRLEKFDGESSLVKKLCSEVKSLITSQLEQSNPFEKIPELQPPSRLVKAVRQNMNKKMQELMRIQQSNSPLLRLVTTMPVKAGLGFFGSEIRSPGNPSQASEITVAQSVPRSLHSDIVGLEFRQTQLLNFRSDVI